MPRFRKPDASGKRNAPEAGLGAAAAAKRPRVELKVLLVSSSKSGGGTEGLVPLGLVLGQRDA